MRTRLKIAAPVCASAVLLLGGCGWMARSWYLSGYERDIERSTRAIEGARNDAQRATGYAQRGRAYSEKARYCRFFKLIPAEEYGRLFGMAVKDDDRAVALGPGSAEAYYGRGRTYFDRATLEAADGKDAKPWLDPAAADLKKAVELNGRNYMAWDMLGLAHESAGDLDAAIADYTREMALNAAGRGRLADAYCSRGSLYQRAKKSVAAIADYEKSIEIGASDDGCSCDPYSPLAGLYETNRQYDKSWEVVRKARKSRRWIAPELLEALKKDSGRNG